MILYLILYVFCPEMRERGTRVERLEFVVPLTDGRTRRVYRPGMADEVWSGWICIECV